MNDRPSMIMVAPPQESEWTCYIIGQGPGSLSYIPVRGTEPNRFWRYMQFLILGWRWRKKR